MTGKEGKGSKVKKRKGNEGKGKESERKERKGKERGGKGRERKERRESGDMSGCQ